MRNYKGIYSILFLLLFLVKSSTFHAYTHDVDHSEVVHHCYTCEIQQLQSDFNFDSAIATANSPLFFIVPIKKWAGLPSQVTVFKPYYTPILSRPPPALA